MEETWVLKIDGWISVFSSRTKHILQDSKQVTVLAILYIMVALVICVLKARNLSDEKVTKNPIINFGLMLKVQLFQENYLFCFCNSALPRNCVVICFYL